MPYSWLLFDADGTLFNYVAAEELALANTFAQFDLPYDEEKLAIYRQINAEVWGKFERGEMSQPQLHQERFGRLMRAVNAGSDSSQFAAAYLANLGGTKEHIEGSLEVVPRLAQKYRLFMITNGIPEVQYGRLALSPIGDLFEGVVISGEVGVAKPDPRIFDAAYEGMGRPPKEQVLIIGDSLSADIAGGHAYGLKTCWYNANGNQETPGIPITHEIHSLYELVGLLMVTN